MAAMTTIMAHGPAILIGYDYRVRLETDIPLTGEATATAVLRSNTSWSLLA